MLFPSPISLKAKIRVRSSPTRYYNNWKAQERTIRNECPAVLFLHKIYPSPLKGCQRPRQSLGNTVFHQLFRTGVPLFLSRALQRRNLQLIGGNAVHVRVWFRLQVGGKIVIGPERDAPPAPTVLVALVDGFAVPSRNLSNRDAQSGNTRGMRPVCGCQTRNGEFTHIE